MNRRMLMLNLASLVVLAMVVVPGFADQTIIDEDFSDISDWNDLSKAVTWGGQSSAVSAFTTSGGSATLTSDARNYAGYNNEDQLLTFTALDYQFPSPVDHNTSTIEIAFRAKWAGGSASGEGSRFNIIVNHAYPGGGLDMDLDDKYDDLESHWWARPAYQVRMRGPIHSTILQYGGGTDIDGEYEIYNNQWWLPGFVAAPGGGSPNDGVPGCETTGSGNSLYTTSWADYKYVIKPDRQEIWMNGTLRATQMLDSDPGNPDYFNYFDTLEGVRLYWRGAAESQLELDQMTVTVIGGTSNPPTAPSNLVATTAGTDQINLTWDDNASNEDGFKIERKEGTGSFVEITTVGVDVTDYADSGLADGTTFTYRVRAYNADGNSNYSNESSATTDALPNPPAGPSNLAATTAGTDAIDLTWMDNADNEDGYRVERHAGDGFFAEVTTLGADVTSYSDMGLNASTTYTYRVVAYNVDGESPWSNEASATTDALPNPPAAPSSLAATAAGTDGINLTWTDNADNEDGFRIERKEGTGSYVEIATPGANMESYSDAGLNPATTYTYRVVAYNADGDSPWSNEASATTDALPNPPAAPSSLAATAAGTDGINLTWTDNADNEDGFRIERKEGTDSYVEIATPGANTESYSDAGLNPSTTYTYRVVAYNADGDSPWSNEASATTDALPNPPAAPTDLVATAAGTEQIDLIWADNADNETGFKIERKTGTDAFAEIATVAADVVSYSDAGLMASTTYTYRVVAYNGDGNSSYSNDASATTQEEPTVPAAPSALAASAVSDSQINLTWTDNSDDETSFKIERKTGSESFAQVATVGANVTSYSNTGLSASTTYTYRVRAANAVGDSPWSNEASATTQDPAQTPYAGSPIPIPGRIEAEDYDLGGEGIAYHDVDGSNNGGKYRSDGVDIQNTSDAGGGYNVGWIRNDEWLEYTVDVAEDGEYDFDVRVASSSAGGTLHIEFDGTDVTGPMSFPATGGWQNWITVSKNNVALTAGQKIMRIYMETSSFNVNYVDIQPAGGTGGGIGIFTNNADIGAVGYAGSASESGGDYTVDGGGKDIWGRSDEFHYVYNDHSGDGEIIAKVTSVENTNGWAKAGVMFRDGTAANAKMAMVIQRPDKQVCFQWRTNTGGSASWNGSLKGGKSDVKWVRLVRSGNDFDAYYSTSSASGPWTKIGNTISIGMSDVKAGLCVTSHNDGTLCTATFTDVSLNGGMLAKGTIVEEEDFLDAIEIPDTFNLAQNYPNPFNPQTTITFNLPQDEFVTLDIYDIRGTRVRRLVQGQHMAGIHNVVWDARDEFGRPVSTGLYIYRITAGEFNMVRKMTFMK